jgi:drug/metabolite transporter (DMT)-like permease
MLLGVGCAVLASTLYSLQLAVQALDARAISVEHEFRLSFFGRLVRRPRWIAANLVGAVGWALQVVALLLAPLTLVQPALGVGLAGLVVGAARWMGERVGRREMLAVAAILVGLTGAVSAAPDRSADHAGARLLAPVLVALAGMALVPYAVSRVRRSGLVGGWSAGFAFAFGALVTKLSSDALASRDAVAFLAWLSLVGAAAAVGILSQMSALQRRPLAQVAPAAFAIETLVPVALAPVILGESWRSGGAAWLLLASFALVIAGAVTLERSAPLDRLLSSPGVLVGERATALLLRAEADAEEMAPVPARRS